MTEINKTTKISVGLLLAVVPMVVAAAFWYDGLKNAQHKTLAAEAARQALEVDVEQHAGDIELSLQQIELELKMYRLIMERRALTADEEDRKQYLEDLRTIIVAEQRKAVA